MLCRKKEQNRLLGWICKTIMRLFKSGAALKCLNRIKDIEEDA